MTFLLMILSILSQSQGVSKNEIKEASYKIAELVKFNYVLKEKGYEIAAKFIKNYKTGRFDFADNWKQLDSVMTKSLNEISNDGHLYTWHNLEIVKQLKQEKSEERKEDVLSFSMIERLLKAILDFKRLK